MDFQRRLIGLPFCGLIISRALFFSPTPFFANRLFVSHYQKNKMKLSLRFLGLSILPTSRYISSFLFFFISKKITSSRSDSMYTSVVEIVNDHYLIFHTLSFFKQALLFHSTTLFLQKKPSKRLLFVFTDSTAFYFC